MSVGHFNSNKHDIKTTRSQILSKRHIYAVLYKLMYICAYLLNHYVLIHVILTITLAALLKLSLTQNGVGVPGLLLKTSNIKVLRTKFLVLRCKN